MAFSALFSWHSGLRSRAIIKLVIWLEHQPPVSLVIVGYCLFMIKFNMNWKNWDFCICKVGDWSQLAMWSMVSLNQQHGHYLQVFQKFRISGQPQDLLNQTLYFNKIFGWFFFLLKFEKYCALMFQSTVLTPVYLNDARDAHY